MPRSYTTLTLDDAKRMLAAAEVKAESFGIAYNIAVVDAGGHLLAFVRQDGALIGSIDLAIDKAATARIFDKATCDLARMSQPGALFTASRKPRSARSSCSAAASRSRLTEASSAP
jgi:uncharacterized protein GlcG (DUF336 family)